MSLRADGPVGHCPGGEPGQDRIDRLHVIDLDGAVVAEKLEQSAKSRAFSVLFVNKVRVLPINLVLAAPGGMLEFEHCLWVEEVILAVASPLVFAATVELTVLIPAGRER